MRLKVLTLNLWHGGRLMDGILDFLEEQDADIVCLQEVYNGTDPKLEKRFRSLQVLQAGLKYPNCAFAPALVDKFKEGDVQCGNAVLAKFPTAARETVFFNEPFLERDPYQPETIERVSTLPRILQRATLDTPVGQLDVFNIHGVWDLEGDNFSDKRRNMRDKILDAINGKPNVILAGDTNARPTNKAITDVEEHLKSVFSAELATTFNMKHKNNPGYASSAVDMILVSPNINIVSQACHDVDISDHFPLSATIEVS